MSEVFVRAIPVVGPGSTGVHLAWLGPPQILYSPGGWKIERRESSRPQHIPDACETVTAAQVKRGQELHLRLGTMLFAPGVFPAGGPCTVCTLELDPAASGIHGVIQTGVAFMAAFRGGKAVTGLGPVAGAFDFGPLSIDRLVIYLRLISSDTILRLCNYQYNKDDWTNAKLLANRQLPLRDLMPGLTDEFAEAKSRLLPGDSLDPQRFRDFANLLRGVATNPRGVVLARTKDNDEFDELGQLDPIRMVYSSPLMRRALGLGYFDNDPALIPGHTYDYRISASFPSGERIFGFHTIPSGTPLPSDFYLYNCRFRLPSPPIVERSPSVPQTGLLVRTSRGIRLQGASTLPWLGDNLAQFCMVIDLPAMATVIAFELDAGHQLQMEAGIAWGVAFSAAIPIPPGPNPTITLPQPANQLRLTGKGFLRSVMVAHGPTTPSTVVISPVTLVNTPLPPPPESVGARSIQSAASFISANQVTPRRPLGINTFWEPASLLNGWSIPGSPPPLDATTFQIERWLEPAGPWTPVLGEDNLVLGTREEPARESAIYPGIDLMQVFPEVPGPRGGSTRFSYDDLFLEGPDGDAKLNPPNPGTMLRYRVAAVDAIGRRGAFIETAPVRLEKHEPPPTPAGADARTTDQLPTAAPTGVSATVLVKGADLSADELALLGTSNNAVVLRWGWRANERSQDPFARHFRIYLAPPLDEVPCTVTSVSEVTGHPGEYQVGATCARTVAGDAANGLYLDAGYPFFIDSHSSGTSIQLRVRTVVAAPGGGFRLPVLGATKLLLPYSSDLTRPRGWRERLLPVVPITTAEEYVFVLRERLQLTDDHPRDSLWIGVSAADDQSYVADTFVSANPLQGNESAVAGVLCQARKYLQPDYTPPLPTGPATRIVAPEPAGGPIQFNLDLTPFLADSGLPGASMVFPERLHDSDLLAGYEVRNNQLVAVSEGTVRNVTLTNDFDRNMVITTLEQGNYEDLDDRFLVLLANLHPFRERLFRAVGENPLPTIAFEESLPSAAARYVYRFRLANAAGQLSVEGAIPSVVVRVPSLSPGPAPVKEPPDPTDPPLTIRVRIPTTSGVTHLLVFRNVATTASAQLVRVPNRPDLLPSGHLRLALEDGTTLEPEAIALSTLEQDARGWLAHIGPQALVGSVRIWALVLSNDGMPSPLAGPWRLNAPSVPAAMPQLSVTASTDAVHLAWSWPTAAVVPVVVEQSHNSVVWRRISAPLLTSQAAFDVASPGSPMKFRLRAQSAFSNVVEI